MQPTCANKIQNDIITNDLIYGLENEHGFEDTAISRVINICTTF